MGNIEIIKFKSYGDERGSLLSFEERRNIPFDIKRIYFLYNNNKTLSRGFHAHINLKQVLVCISGKCDVIVDDGKIRNNYELNNPEEGLLIQNLMWRELHNLSSECIIAVMANQYYDEKDYIRDYEEFLAIKYG